MTYDATAVSDTVIAHKKPITLQQGRQLRDNTIAIAEGASGAPIMQNGGWHPYDRTVIGGAETGLIYDFATDGAVASVETPTFEDGFEYMLFIDRIGSSLSSQNLVIEVYRETDAAYSTAWTSTGTSGIGATTNSAMVEIVLPRLAKTLHPVRGWAYLPSGSGEVINPAPVYNATVQKISKSRIKWSSGGINAGKIYLYRRGVQI